MQEEYHEFIIIGAGIAGLEAALVLAENKKDFIVLEASDKIGGRIATQKIKHAVQEKKKKGNVKGLQWIEQDEEIMETLYECGATWVSKEHSYLIRKMKQYGLQLYPQYFDGLNIYGIEDGKYSHVESIGDYFKNFKKELGYLIDKIENCRNNVQEMIEAEDNRPIANIKRRLSQRSIGDESPTFKEIKSMKLIEEYVNYFDNITIHDYIKKEINNQFLSDLIINEIQTLQCISCKKLCMLQLIQDTGSLELLKLYCDKIQNTIDGMKVKTGMISVVEKTLERILGILNEDDVVEETEILRLNTPVIKIDNQIGEDVKISVLSDSNKKYICNKVLFSVPIAVASKIEFVRISENKQLIFDNQEMGNVTRVYLVFETAFWRGKYSGYGSFGSKFPFNEITDLSPANLACGILAFVFIGESYKNWTLEMAHENDRFNYLKKIIADVFLKGNEKSSNLEKVFMFSRSFSDHQYIRAAYQASTKPSIWKKITQNGDNYSESYSRDEFNIFYIGSQFAEEHSTYIEGAIRLARRKTYHLLGKEDPWALMN